MSYDRLRKLVFVPVVSRPPLAGCWSVNLTDQGIGLVARTEEGQTIAEGESLDLSFTLPTGAQLFVRGVVRWKIESKGEGEDTTSYGVRFESFGGTGRVELLRFLSAYRVRVVVSGSTPAFFRTLESKLRGEVQMEEVNDQGHLESALFRGDVSAVLLCGENALDMAAFVDRVSTTAAIELGRPAETKPRTVMAAPVRAEHLIPLFNARALDQALAPDAPVGEIAEAIRRACRAHGIRLEQQRMSIELERVLRDRHRPIGDASASEKRAGFSSAAMREAMASVRQVVGYRVTVLLQGETGTGKELLARQVHALSPRAKQPFVVQDCGALVETLLDSELFGHVKGAFTGAVSDHPGLFVLADGGTIFLDEIENTTSNLQAKLLRVLETGEVRPVGGASVRRVDVRVVAASNRPLQEEVNQGRFRADLFYRLNSFLIEVPPLRGRTEDILPLAREFIDQANRSLGKSARGLTRQAERILLDWSWPGNVRELRNVIERAVLLSGPMELLDVSRLPRSMQGKQEVPNAMNVGVLSPSQPLRHVLEATERDALAAALKHHQGVLRRAAQALSMDPQTFRRRARALGLIPNQPRSGRTASSN